MESLENLFDADIYELECTARKYIIQNEFEGLLQSLDIPDTDEQKEKVYVEGKSHLTKLFGTLLNFNENNLYGNFGMFLLELHTGKEDKALFYANRGIKNNAEHYEVNEFRAAVAWYYEDVDKFREANELYIDNINAALGNMKSYIDSFLKESTNKLVFTTGGVKKYLIEEKKRNPADSFKEATPIDTYLHSKLMPKCAAATQDVSQRQEFIKAKILHDTEHYEMANQILHKLDIEFTNHESNLHAGITGLKVRVEETFKEKLYKVLKN
jgi:hypothetical protein